MHGSAATGIQPHSGQHSAGQPCRRLVPDPFAGGLLGLEAIDVLRLTGRPRNQNVPSHPGLRGADFECWSRCGNHRRTTLSPDRQADEPEVSIGTSSLAKS